MTFAPIEEAVRAVAAGEFVVVVDDADRENEGDLILAAEKATPEKLGFMIRHTSGIVCLPLLAERLDDLAIPLMVNQNTDRRGTAFTVSIDYRRGTSTGISAADRAATIQAAIDPGTVPSDLTRPGHIFPLRYREGGVLERPGHTEAAIDLARLAGLYPAGVLAELMHDDGSVRRLPSLAEFARRHRLPIVSIADLVRYRLRHERLVRREGSARLPTRHGEFRAVGYRSLLDGREHLALVRGEVATPEPVLVRVHSECLTGDAIGSRRCDCGAQLGAALDRLGAEQRGVLVYLRGHEGRGIGLLSKLAAYALQDEGRDTVEANEELGFPADGRDYGVAAQIFDDLGVGRLRLLTNNPAKARGLEAHGLEVVERLPLLAGATPENRRYLEAKAAKLGHLLGLEEE